MAGEPARVANGEEAAVAIPPVITPVEVEVPIRVVPVEIRHIAIAIDLRDRAIVRGIIHITVHRILSGLNRICDLVCHQ